MIKVKYNDNYVKITGHAGFADYGNDIVCASVSSIVYTTINGIYSFSKDTIKVEDNKDLIIKIVKNDYETITLINNMLTLLDELSKQYPKNIKISKGE